jgi:putative toxin-antitoxin system antitoxin component (TIGR02293 family)
MWRATFCRMAIVEKAPPRHAADPTREERMQALLGGPKVLRRRGTSLLQLHAAVEGGLHVAVIEELLKNLRASREELLVALSMSLRTLSRRQKTGVLSPEESDRALRLARVAAHAEEVLGGRDAAVSWLHRGNRALGGRKPLELVRTDAGAELVIDVLGRLEHGVVG